MSAARDLFEQALALEPTQRAQLARELLESLGPEDAPGDTEERAEKAEIERRVRRVLADGPRGASWSEVRAQIERDLEM